MSMCINSEVIITVTLSFIKHSRSQATQVTPSLKHNTPVVGASGVIGGHDNALAHAKVAVGFVSRG